jgi:predicted porin
MGSLNLGRQYTASYSMVQGKIDPFGNVTVANLRDIGMRPGATVQGLKNTPAGVATVSKVRVTDSARYDYSKAGLNVAVSIAQAAQDGAPGPNKPFSIGANYKSGPLFVGVAYENPQFDNDYLWNVGAKYAVGRATLSAGGGFGRTANNLKVSGLLLGVNYNIGSGDLKFGFAKSKVGDGPGAVERQRYGAGYHYKLSKRTTIYTDLAYEGEIDDNQMGADLGLVVRF